jgi:hypothetical protein
MDSAISSLVSFIEKEVSFSEISEGSSTLGSLRKSSQLGTGLKEHDRYNQNIYDGISDKKEKKGLTIGI